MSEDRPVTYHEVSGGNVADHTTRYRELADRDLMARTIATLKAHGEWTEERASVLDPDEYPPLTISERLEMLALGETIARYYRHPSQVDYAVKAGASWQQIADATGTSPEAARAGYRKWAEGQHKYAGMDAAEYAASVKRAEADR